MSERKVMAEDYLLATHAALMEFAPDLKHHVEGILRQDQAAAGADSPESVDPRFVVHLKASDAEAIVRALQTVQDTEGYEKSFNNRSINLLMAAWSWHAQRLRKENP
jgi:hypothetical protein